MADNLSERLANALGEIKSSVDQMSSETKKSDWMKTGQIELANMMCDLDLPEFALNVILFLTKYIEALEGTLYQVDEKTLTVLASTGNDPRDSEKISLIGQCALKGGAFVFFDDLQQFSLFVPLQIGNDVVGVLKFATSQAPDTTKLEFLRIASKTIARGMKASLAYDRMKRLLEENTQQKEKLKLAERHKSDFLAKMSHELKTPLNSLLLLSKQLADNDEENLSYHQIEAATIINRSGHDLLDLINDILDHSKVEAGSLPIHNEVLSIRSIVENLQRQFRPIVREKELQFLTMVNDDVPLTITTDRKRIAQVLKNFLSNAIKFTSKGPVTLKIHRPHHGVKFALPHLHADNCIGFSVVDTGIGIAKEHQERIFEAYQQADDLVDKIYGGTGLGLSISRELAKLLKGEIQLESEQGKGSSFTLYLPCVAREYRPSVVEASLDSQTAKILIVDDDMRNTFAIASILKKTGMTIVLANSGRAALDKLENEPDIKLVIMNGFEAVRELRQERQYGHLPIIALTATAIDEDKIRAMDVGANDILTKPVDIDKLINSIKTWLCHPTLVSRRGQSRCEVGIVH